MKRTTTLLLSVSFALFTLMGIAQDESKKSTYLNPDTIQEGMQGSVNPMNANAPIYTGDELLDATFPNSWPLFGSDVRMRIGGYVKGDFIRDFDYVGDRYEFELGSIAVDGTPESELGGITTFHAKESRRRRSGTRSSCGRSRGRRARPGGSRCRTARTCRSSSDRRRHNSRPGRRRTARRR